jgi:hypothetical protein
MISGDFFGIFWGDFKNLTLEGIEPLTCRTLSQLLTNYTRPPLVLGCIFLFFIYVGV